MRNKYLLLNIIILSIFIISCNAQKKKEIINFSIEECLLQNIQDSSLMTGWYYISDSNTGFVRSLDDTDEYYNINPNPIVTVEDITKMSVENNIYSELFLSMNFGKRGTERWQVATKNAIGKNLAFILNNTLIYKPMVNSEIPNGVSAIGNIKYKKEDYLEIKKTIENNQMEMQKK
jgi:hypothetical protein